MTSEKHLIYIRIDERDMVQQALDRYERKTGIRSVSRMVARAIRSYLREVEEVVPAEDPDQ